LTLDAPRLWGWAVESIATITSTDGVDEQVRRLLARSSQVARSLHAQGFESLAGKRYVQRLLHGTDVATALTRRKWQETDIR
jgi:hypothetical protein